MRRVGIRITIETADYADTFISAHTTYESGAQPMEINDSSEVGNA